MANAQGAFGLKPVRTLLGSPYNGQSVKCYVSPLCSTAIFVGDLVALSPTLANAEASMKHPTVDISSGADDTIPFGVVVGVDPNPSNLEQKNIPALTGGFAYVCTDPNVVYHVRDDGAGVPTAVWVGQNANFTYAVGSTATGLSGVVLDSTTPTNNSSYLCIILGLADLPGNELDDYAIWEVVLGHSRMMPIGAAGDTGILGVTSS